MTSLSADGPDLARRLLARDRDAVPAALDLADDRRPEQRRAARQLLDALEREAAFPGAARVGVTGAPGAGKSTLLDGLVRSLRRRGDTVGVVAVDPSSRRSGGALLGDRIRIRSGGADPGVFIRSMAARDRLGGLSDAARAGVAILAAAFDAVFVETVGVGQSEADVASLSDTLVYVVSPGSGDAVQFMKAGILELPDLFAVNKADQGEAAERTARDLASGLGLSERPGETGAPPVLLLSARDGTGIDELVAALDDHRRRIAASGELERRRRHGRETGVLEALERRYGSYGLESLGGRRALQDRVRERASVSAFGLVADLGREIEDALRKPA